MTKPVFKAPPCSCGGPALGTDHAPDCAIELAHDDYREDLRQWKTEQAEEALS